MKKLLMATAILALGVTAFGVDKTASEPVKVRAELVQQDLEISDIDGRPILLDFGKIATSRKTDALATIEFKVEATGEITNVTGMTFELGKATDATNPAEVEIVHIDPTVGTQNTMTAKLGLDKYSVTPATTLNAGTIHTGRINGKLEATQWSGKAVGVYEGQTELKVTVAAGA